MEMTKIENIWLGLESDTSSHSGLLYKRYSAEIFAVASQMLGHALTAKTAKLNKKLKMIDLQLKKVKLDQGREEETAVETAHGQILSRNDLLERLIGNRDQKTKDA